MLGETVYIANDAILLSDFIPLANIAHLYQLNECVVCSNVVREIDFYSISATHPRS